MKIELGKSYKTRGGFQVTVVEVSGNKEYPWWVSCGKDRWTCDKDGYRLHSGFQSNDDLVSEWEDPAPITAPDADLALALSLLKSPLVYVCFNDGSTFFSTSNASDWNWLTHIDVQNEIERRKVASLRLKYADLIAAQEAGRKVQSRSTGTEDWNDGTWKFDDPNSEYRLKPTEVRWIGVKKGVSNLSYTFPAQGKSTVSTVGDGVAHAVVRLEIDPDNLEVISCTVEKT